MNTKIFDIHRIGSLLRYDWVMNKRTAGLTLMVITAIYTFVALTYFVGKSEFSMLANGEDYTGLTPAAIGIFIRSFFSYAGLATVLVVTTVMTKKFCEPRTSTSYLTLPGTSLEKFTVMLLDYAIAYGAIWILYFIFFYITMAICAIANPELNWMQDATEYINPIYSVSFFHDMTGQYSLEDAATQLDNEMSGLGGEFLSMLSTAFIFAPFSTLASFAFYLNLCMLFRTNCQIKAIALYYGMSFVLGIMLVLVFIGAFFNVVTNTDATQQEIVSMVYTVFNCIRGFLYVTPAIAAALLYILYRQICNKQTK